MTAPPIQSIGIADLKDRAHKAAVDLEAHRQLESAKVELRDRCVIELYDARCPVKEIAQVVMLAPSRVMQLVAKAG